MRITATRLAANPLITPASSPKIGDNINGPSVIRVPDWIGNPLGRYYMYFGDHGGRFIRLAYADAPEGPWTVYEPGTLKLEQATPVRGHIASPDVHVDSERRQIRMYYHGIGRDRPGQWSSVAVSTDGITFTSSDMILGTFYLRAWPWQGKWYSVAKVGKQRWGVLSCSPDGLQPFDYAIPLIDHMRHCAVHRIGNTLVVLYSRWGDAPERIVGTAIDLSPADWRDWRTSEPVQDVLRPELDYEGIAYPEEPSAHGSAVGVRQLRDPCLFDDDGTMYLYYSVAGEEGIAGARLTITGIAE